MAVTPAGMFSKVLDNARTLIANSPSFRTWTGAADVAAAKAFIHVVGEEFDNTARPFVVVAFGDEPGELERIAQGAGNYFIQTGQIFVLFEDDVASANQAVMEEAELAFMNNVGAVFGDIFGTASAAGLTGTDAYLSITNSGIDTGPMSSGLM